MGKKITWISVCNYCGMSGSSVRRGLEFGAPSSRPIVSGKCKSNPFGNEHAPKWICYEI